MTPELHLVKGETTGDSSAAKFAPDRAVPTRLAQLSAVFGLIALAVALVVQQTELKVAFGAAAAIQVVIFIGALGAALKRAAVRYTLTSQRLEIERGLIARRRESIDLFRIRDVVLEQGFVQRLRGLGDITLFSTDQVEPTLVLTSIGDAQPIYEQLRDAASRARQQRVVQVDR